MYANAVNTKPVHYYYYNIVQTQRLDGMCFYTIVQNIFYSKQPGVALLPLMDKPCGEKQVYSTIANSWRLYKFQYGRER